MPQLKEDDVEFNLKILGYDDEMILGIWNIRFKRRI